MEAVYTQPNFSSGPSFKEVVTTFFSAHTPDSTKYLCWKLFQCWALKDCTIKAELTDEEVAFFFDQVIELVTAAYAEHQSDHSRGGAEHDA